MADIDAELKAFKEAVYGEDVRDALVSSITAINEQVEDSLVEANEVLNQLSAANETAETALTDLASATETAEEYTATVAAYLEDYPLQLLDGTETTYKAVMRMWFLAQGIDADSPDAETLTALCDKWYALTRDQWLGYVDFYQPDVSAVTTGTKGGDAADLTCTPSTDSVANTDDYAGLPLFACVDCNWEMYTDDSGNAEILITAIDGITSNFKRTDTSIFVGVLQMSPYEAWVEEDETYRFVYASYAGPYTGIRPRPECVKQDGTFRQWMCHPKYDANVVDSKLTCCSGQAARGFISHTNAVTYKNNIGSTYSGFSIADKSFLQSMMMIKYGSLTLDSTLIGCVNNNYQYPALVTEEGVNRVLCSTAAASHLEVGGNMLIGTYSSSTDRGTLYAISGSSSAKITAIETVTVDDTEYTAVYFDNIDAFDSTANGTATSGTTYISTAPWDTGMTDTVLGNDGAPVSCTSGKYPIKIQGIEIMTGAYADCADALWYYYADDDGNYVGEVYLCDTASSQASAITNYEATGIILDQGSADAWRYIKKNGWQDGILYPIELDGSSSTYTGDTIYFKGNSYTGTLCYRALGHLILGVADGGLSCVSADLAVGAAYWRYGGRLSCNGNRGAWTA